MVNVGYGVLEQHRIFPVSPRARKPSAQAEASDRLPRIKTGASSVRPAHLPRNDMVKDIVLGVQSRPTFATSDLLHE